MLLSFYRLIEELKLLANMTVARVIKEAFPDKAVLRCHEPPDLKDIISLVRILTYPCMMETSIDKC